MTIPRHNFPTENAARGVEVITRSAGRAVEDLEENPQVFERALGITLTVAKSRCALDPLSGELPTWEAWVTAMQVGSAMFASARTAEGTVRCRISDKDRGIPATGPQPYADAGNWLSAFYLAIICREQDRMTELCSVPVSLLRESGAIYDEYIYAWVETLQAFWLNRPGLGEKLVEAVEGTKPEAARIATPEMMLKILYPPLELLHRFIRQDHAQFNVALSDALTWHKEFWTADEDRAMRSDGLVALGPLAIACLAFDSGYPIEVQSEYLPKALLEGAWLGEFPT
ncbi:immunity 49 family protein [Streptomyces sp. NPDC001678]|uniref:immunity 49 family protein n=1 Tax=Streptomyces sp. NPDC001678 TaxID=3364599 RepID=UPI00369695AD